MKHILVLEDNHITQSHLEQIINELDIKCKVHQFTNVHDAYKCVLEQTIDLFLVDIILDTEKPGDVSGLKFVQNIRRIDHYRHALVIFITSLEDPELYSYRDLHCYYFLEKPFDMMELKKLLQECLETKGECSKSKLLLFRKEGILLAVNRADIVWAECRNHIMYVYTNNNDTLRIPYLTVKKLLVEVDSQDFIQCRRNAIFNRNYVRDIDKVNRYIWFRDNLGRTEIGNTYIKKVIEGFK